jgi:hypothetical protein
MFLRNISLLSSGYTALYPRRKETPPNYYCESLELHSMAQGHLFYIRTIIMTIQVISVRMETDYS